jgi:predicted amidohydrolase YtcJ
MHAIGDRAVRNALDAVADARKANGVSDRRHHIAHVQIVHPDDVGRFGELDVIANCQPLWAQSDPQMEELTVPFLGAERVGMQYPFGSILRGGARLAGGSDWSVTTANPLEEVDVMVNRRNPRQPEAAAFLPEERVSLEVAVAAFTSGTAYVNHDDHDSGRLAPGMRADVAVLDRNIFALDEGTVADAEVDLTLAAGNVVYHR